MRSFVRTFIIISAVALTVPTAVAQEQSVHKPGNGVTLPVVTKQVKAVYTQQAMDARIEGTVGLEVVVKSDGMVGDVKIARSLDPTYGLDDQAVKAMKQWQFKPGTKDGTPVAVQVDVMINFTLK
ncbi:MAG TPA: energy transducer TonB [Vicinamibacterales bacterium]|jgi:protein TonB|nr:energy transducer TonB [Vicinamibacterales bacterium]